MAPVVPVAAASAANASANPAIDFGTGYVPLENDVVIVWPSSTTTATVADVADWTNLLGSTVDVESDSHEISAAYHVVTAAEQTAGTHSWTLTAWYGTSETGQVEGVVLRGVDTGNRIDSVNSTYSDANTATPHVLAGLTGTDLSDNSVVVSSVASDGTETYTAMPTGWTWLRTGGANQGRATLIRDALTVANSDVAATNITPSAGNEYASITVALGGSAPASYTGPAYASVGTYANNGGVAVGSKNIPRPTSGATGAGSIDLVFLYVEDGTATITPPAGDSFTECPDSPVVVTGTRAHAIHIYWCQSASSSGNYVFAASVNSYMAGQAMRITGVDSATPFDVTAKAIDAGTANRLSPTVSDITTVDQTLLVYACGTRQLAAAVSSPPWQFTERIDNSDASGCGLCVSTKGQPSAGPTGIANCYWTVANAQSAWIGALKSAPAGNITVTSIGASLAVTGGTSTVATPVAINSVGATLAITGGTAVIAISRVINSIGASLTVTGGTSLVATPRTILSVGASLTAAGGTSTVATPVAINSVGATLAITGGTSLVATPRAVVSVGASLAITGGTAVVAIDRPVLPVGASLTISGGTAVVAVDRPVVSVGASLAITGGTALITTPVAITSVGASLTVTGGTSTVTITTNEPVAITSVGASLAITSGTATVTIGTVVVSVGATLTIAVGTSTVATPVTINSVGGSLSITGATSTVIVGIVVTPTGAGLALTGGTSTIATPVAVTSVGATLAVTTGTATIIAGTVVNPSGAALTATGGTATVVAPYTVTPQGASLTLTGGTAYVAAGGNISIASVGASLTVTGAEGSVFVTDPKSVIPTGANLALTGGTSTVATPVAVTPSGALLSIASGTSLVAAPAVVAPSGASLIITGGTSLVTTTTNVLVRPIGADLTITSGTATVLTPRVATPGAATTLTITGATPNVGIDYRVNPDGGTLALLGGTAEILTPVIIDATPAELKLLGGTSDVLQILAISRAIELAERRHIRIPDTPEVHIMADTLTVPITINPEAPTVTIHAGIPQTTIAVEALLGDDVD